MGGVQNRMLDPLELEFQAVVSTVMWMLGADNRFYKSNTHS